MALPVEMALFWSTGVLECWEKLKADLQREKSLLHYSITPLLQQCRASRKDRKPPLGAAPSPDSLFKRLPVTNGEKTAVGTESFLLSRLGVRHRLSLEQTLLESLPELSQAFFPDGEQIPPLPGISPEKIQLEIFF